MILVPSMTEKNVAVLGLGASGLVAARALVASGAHVLAWDDDAATRSKAEAQGLSTSDLGGAAWSEIESLVLSPGIPHTFPAAHPIAALARDAGCEIISDVELLGRSQPNATYIGVTGTNGKSTTTALIGHILQQAGRDIEVGGNLGPPVMNMRPLGTDGIYVLEMSSYQLERTASIVFDVAVLLNLAADHLDRHGGMDGYIAAKKRIFGNGADARSAIIGADDPDSRAVADELRRDGRTVVEITGATPLDGQVGVEGSVLVDCRGGKQQKILDLSTVATLPGRHNWQNAAAAYAACRSAALSAAEIARHIATFSGLAHRQERIAVINDISYVNDSKATNPNATANALASYPAIYWIAGGLAKEGGFAELKPYVKRILHAFLIGDAAKVLAKFLGRSVKHTLCRDLDDAVAQAHAMASAPGADRSAVVLLSPACASFDQFANFAARGDAFRHLVVALPGTRGELAAAGGA